VIVSFPKKRVIEPLPRVPEPHDDEPRPVRATWHASVRRQLLRQQAP